MSHLWCFNEFIHTQIFAILQSTENKRRHYYSSVSRKRPPPPGIKSKIGVHLGKFERSNRIPYHTGRDNKLDAVECETE